MSPLAVTQVGIPLHDQPPGRRIFSPCVAHVGFIRTTSSTVKGHLAPQENPMTRHVKWVNGWKEE